MYIILNQLFILQVAIELTSDAGVYFRSYLIYLAKFASRTVLEKMQELEVVIAHWT